MSSEVVPVQYRKKKKTRTEKLLQKVISFIRSVEGRVTIHPRMAELPGHETFSPKTGTDYAKHTEEIGNSMITLQRASGVQHGTRETVA